jgi:glyceraldehyde-3-phosphate dehydrogenase (NADP+)
MTRKQTYEKIKIGDFEVQKGGIHSKYLIGGTLHDWKGAMQEVRSPLFDGILGYTPLLTPKESLEALEAAVKAYDNGFGKWPTMSTEERISKVECFKENMVGMRKEIVALLVVEIAKSVKDAEKEFDRTIKYIDDTIQALKKMDRDSSKPINQDGIMAQIRRSPLGVVLCMGPFNYPLNETFTTLIPALIMGNTVIMKPPRYGVLLYSPLLGLFKKCFPKGVVNVIYGNGEEIISPIMRSGKVNVLAFIGSCKVADILKKQCPNPHRMKSVLGLEAKNPAIILPDADLDEAVKECVLGSLTYNGQRCTALKIIFVHKKIAKEFIKRFAEAVNGLKVGMPWEEGVFITPLVEEGKVSRMKACIDDAVSKGAEVANQGGGSVDGSLMSPAVLYPVREGMTIYSEEQFGPVVPVVPYSGLEEVLSYISESDYGQQVSIFGNDPVKIAKLIDPLVNQVCRVNINSQCQRGPDTFPFTGRKGSAEGTLSVSDALRVFSIRSLVAANANNANKKIFKGVMDKRLSNFLSTDYIF